MKRAYKLRAYPTRPQQGRAVRLLADHCDLYNAALQERREAWRMRKVSVSYGDQSAQLREIRAADPDGQGRHSFTAQQQTLRRLNTVFAAYFRRVRDAEQARKRARSKGEEAKEWGVGNPRFKPRQRFDQVLFVAGDGAKWEPADDGRWAHATFQAVGRVKVRQHRKARARPGSGNHKRIRRQLAREWRKVRNRRRDFHHKTARVLVDSCDALALEALRVDAMTASASGTVEQPGRNVRQKAGLNRSILDVGWAQFTRILTAKAESAGRRVVRVNPSHTSLTCHACGARCTRPRQDTVVCPAHGVLDADLNGARNIASRAGLGSGQASVA